MVRAQKKIKCNACNAKQILNEISRSYEWDDKTSKWFRIYECKICFAEMFRQEVIT